VASHREIRASQALAGIILAMATRERPRDRADRLATEARLLLGADLRRARVAAGISLRDAAAAASISHTELWRLERGQSRVVPIARVFRTAAAVGLTASVRLFPDGDPIRDAGQSRVLERLRGNLHPGLGWRTEVPLPNVGDPRAWDAVIRSRGWWRPVEVEAALRDAQATERRLALKQRDGRAPAPILVLADTPRNRAALAAAPAAFPTLPVRTRPILSALRRGVDPGSGIVFL
jgi:transcriptional regulator with XRE-family HTH domain